MRLGKYRGRKVFLEKPFRETKPGKKEFKVYVRNPKTGKVNLIRFGDADMMLKSHIPTRKKAYCSRTRNLSRKGDKLSPNYWSRRRWGCAD